MGQTLKPRMQFCLDHETPGRIADLAKWWGGIAKLPNSAVVDEAIARAWKAEANKIRREKRT